MNESSTSTILSDSVESLSSSRLSASGNHDAKRGASQISRSYKQASNFFLQRRFPEALLTIQPIVNPQKRNSIASGDGIVVIPASISGASRPNRVKVWSLYLTLLNAILELGGDEGRNLFGNTVWRSISSKVKDGLIWEEVAKNGYGGNQSSIDAEVVSNLATLLITHSPTQTITQQRLEAYLSAPALPNLDLSGRFDAHSEGSPSPHNGNRAGGADTPRDLNSRVKVIELYALHVLPRNEQWDYAREFITMCELLDEDTREEFLQTLQSLEDQRHDDIQRESDLCRERDAKLERQRQERDQSLVEDTELNESRHPLNSKDLDHTRTGSEKDYGIEDSTPSRKSKSSTGTKDPKHWQASQQPRKSPSKVVRGGIYAKSIHFMATLRQFVTQTAKSVARTPTLTLRILLFLAALLMAMGRQDVRQIIARLTNTGWVRFKRTVGMGTKISYI